MASLQLGHNASLETLIMGKDGQWLTPIFMASLSLFGCSIPSQAAEQIIFSYRAFEFGIAITDLEIFAETGKLEGSLKPLARRLDADTRTEIQTLLQTELQINVTAASQLLYSKYGEGILKDTGNILQNSQRQNGFLELRSAMIQSARTHQSISPIALFKNYPSRSIYLNGSQLNQGLQSIQARSRKINALIQALSDESPTHQTSPTQIEMKVPEPFSSDRQNFQIIPFQVPQTDKYRAVSGQIYQPQKGNDIPLIIISPGFGDDRTAFRALSSHLASHQIAVAILEHSGSDRHHFEALLQGYQQQVLDPEEWIKRPEDVSHFLDWLATDRHTNLQISKLNLNAVGVVGYSLGGHTALALAGASSSSEHLQQICDQQKAQKAVLDLVPLMLCSSDLRALNPNHLHDFKDPRVKGIVTINSFGSYFFQPQSLSQVKVPSLVITGTKDFVSPSLEESICPFNRMNQPQQSLVLIEKGQHFFGNDMAEEGLFRFSPPLKQPNPVLMSTYLNGLVLNFVGLHLSNKSRETSISQTVRELSQSTHPLHVVQRPTSNSMTQIMTEVCPTNTHDARKSSLF